MADSPWHASNHIGSVRRAGVSGPCTGISRRLSEGATGLMSQEEGIAYRPGCASTQDLAPATA